MRQASASAHPSLLRPSPMSTQAAPGTATAASAQGPFAVTMIARQAIVNTQQTVIGHELFNRARPSGEHTATSDVLLVFTALSHTGAEELLGNKLIFINCTHETLAGGIWSC